MRRFIRSRSEFFDGVANWQDGVLLSRPYAYAQAFGLEASQVKKMCKEGRLPHVFDGENYLIVIDNRKFGEGGKFTSPRSPEHGPNFPLWKGGRT